MSLLDGDAMGCDEVNSGASNLCQLQIYYEFEFALRMVFVNCEFVNRKFFCVSFSVVVYND